MLRSRMSALLAAFTVTGAIAAVTPAAQASSTAITAPTARYGPAMAYDAARGQVVLFGGHGSTRALFDDTWTWDGTDWTLRTPVHHPSPRSYTTMAYDAARGQVVLFGGDNGMTFGDTWTWDGTDWTQRTPVHAPSTRAGEGMAYDAARGQVVLFGGFNYTEG